MQLAGISERDATCAHARIDARDSYARPQMNKPIRWSKNDVAGIETSDVARLPEITDAQVVPVAPDIGFWDAWPVQHPDGTPIALPDGSELWMALGAPRLADPDARHDHARIQLVQRRGRRWVHLGPAMPEGFSPGSREWSGSAVLDAEQGVVTLYFTAAGRRGEVTRSYEQRMFSAEATLQFAQGAPILRDWRGLREIVRLDPRHYMSTDQVTGAVGRIKAFRDPAFFRDPASGADYLFFAGSVANSGSTHNGAVGLARRTAVVAEWELCRPVISADGLNNELERPHVVQHSGLYYLFWSTQRHVFEPACAGGPTGLYGMVSPQLLDGWKPLNGSGLVFGNPERAPAQSYSWLVLPDLSVASFVDDWAGSSSRRFGGTFAPFVRLALEGDRAWLQGLA